MGTCNKKKKNVLTMPISAIGLNWLTSAARYTIKMRSKEVDVNKAVKLLKTDLINGLYHCFDHHNNCSADFCTTAMDKMTPTTQSTYNDESDCSQHASSIMHLDEVQCE